MHTAAPQSRGCAGAFSPNTAETDSTWMLQPFHKEAKEVGCCGVQTPRPQPSPEPCWCCTDHRPEPDPALNVVGARAQEGERQRAGRLPAHPAPLAHIPGGHSLDELPSKGFELASRCCCCQQQVQALPRQHVTQDPQQALGGFGVICIHSLQKEKKKKKKERSHGESMLQSSNKTPATEAELISCQSHPTGPLSAGTCRA